MNFLLDHNLPPDLARALNALARTSPYSVVSLRDKFPPNTPDIVWIGNLAAESGWVIVTGDRNILKRPHELAAWKTAKLTTFILAQAWSDMTFWDKSWLLTRWWPRLVEIAGKAVSGTAFVVPACHAPKDLRPYK